MLRPATERRWRRGLALGCSLLLAGCLLLMVLPYLWRIGSVAFAKQRWAQSGITHYTLEITQACFCPVFGAYQITVQNGQVLTATSLSRLPHPTPAELPAFNRLTVDSILNEVSRESERSWLVPIDHWFSASFNWQYGYVTDYRQEIYLVADGSYHYTAQNLTPINQPNAP